MLQAVHQDSSHPSMANNGELLLKELANYRAIFEEILYPIST